MGAVHMQITTIGLDIAKNVFQVHGIDGNETVVVRKQLRRGKLIAFFESLAPCLVGIEACAPAHHWARELTRLGHQVRLMPAKDVKAYIKRNKNDAADAAAICEAVRRPTMRFVRIKSTDQQCQLMQHRTRDLMMRQRTQLINALRAHLAELGIVAAMGDKGVTELLMIVADEDDGRLPVEARASLALLAAQLNATGTLDVSCTAPGDEVVLLWTERGGPHVEAPAAAAGFGSKLVIRSMSGLGGSINSDWSTAGVVITLRMKADRLAR